MIGERLRLARKRAGYSLRDLAARLGNQVTPQAIGKYERDAMSPSRPVLSALAATLNVPVEFLEAPSAVRLGQLDFRKHSGTSSQERSLVEAAVIEQVERYLYIEEIVGLDSASWRQPVQMETVSSLDEAENAANAVREAWKLGSDPIPNLTELLERQGIKIVLLALPQRVSGLTCFIDRPGFAPVPVIVANRGHSLERRRLTMAHELAHRLIRTSGALDIEKAANRFAGAFLQPAEHVRAEVGRHRNGFGVPELLHTKRLYRVSAAALVVRLRDLSIISNEIMAYIFQTVGRGWRTTEPEPLESTSSSDSLEAPQRYDRLCYRALAEGLIDSSKAAELLGKDTKTLRLIMKGKSAAR
jgi:Zn-dependent peptidase ImmA (M78 family)/transcriptional regulator with XRE-family HTH domain